MTDSPERRALLQAQAADVQARHPELYEYLRQRDKELRRALTRIPSPADVELSASVNIRDRLTAIRRNSLIAGIGDLGGPTDNSAPC